MRRGFQRLDLRKRYDVATIREDAWHSYSGRRTKEFVQEILAGAEISPHRLLNAGSGAYEIAKEDIEEISVDLFNAPLVGRRLSVCASVTELPFRDATFGCIVCVGEVLGYCDPGRTVAEFQRILAPAGLLICDFGSSLSFRHRFSSTFARAADLIVDEYNGAPEKIWVYNPEYIRALITGHGFEIRSQFGIHRWSSIARRLGFTPSKAVAIEQMMSFVPSPSKYADLVTIVAARSRAE